MNIVLFALGILCIVLGASRLGWTLLVLAAVLFVGRLAFAAYIISTLVQHATSTT